jgi:hypothetical protein
MLLFALTLIGYWQQHSDDVKDCGIRSGKSLRKLARHLFGMPCAEPSWGAGILWIT